MTARKGEHDGSHRSCWDCLSPEDRLESRRIWVDIVEDPFIGLAQEADFSFDLARAVTEVVSGQCIEMRRPEQDGKRIIFPRSLFWRFVDLIHEERKQIQE